MSKPQRTSGRRKRSPRGVHVHDRDAADRALAKREREERRQEALDEVRREQERLERRIEREKAQPAVGAALGAGWTPPTLAEVEIVDPDSAPPPLAPMPVEVHPLLLRFPDLPWEGDGNRPQAIGQARTLLRQGYNIRKVIATYEVGLKWFDDIIIDDMGFGPSDK